MANRTTPNNFKPFSSSDYQRPGLAEDEVQELKEAFDLFDYRGVGTISVRELQQAAMDILAPHSRDRLISGIIRQADMDGSGRLNFEEFLHMVLNMKTSDEQTREDFKQVFGLHYDKKNGLTSHESLYFSGYEAGEGIFMDDDW